MEKDEIKAIYSAITKEDVSPYLPIESAIHENPNTDLAYYCAEAAAIGSIVSRLEAYRRSDTFDNWGFHDCYNDGKHSEILLGSLHENVWAAFRCGYVQALKDRL